VKIPVIDLADKYQIPQVGLGTWKLKDQAEFYASFKAALAAGYRHIDSAQAYDNEHLLGVAWKKSGLKREELFITTKIAVTNFGYKKTKRSFEESLIRLQTDYVDLLLLHFPVTLLRKKSWQALEEIQTTGGARSIGVSNYTIRHLEEMKSYANIMPAVNQVELHVFLQQPELIQYCHDHHIAVEAYSPLARATVMDNEAVKRIAKKHNKTYTQIMLRWCIDRDLIVLPKSANPDRVRENIDIFDFRLDADDLETLRQQDRELRVCWSAVHVP
jgi:methylglyoxal/glyoxal reductase